jgi:hypothetical protein
MTWFSKVTTFIKKYERHLSTASMFFGFIFDNLTLKRIDVWYDNAVIAFYILVSSFGIILVNLQGHKYGNYVPEKIKPFLHLIVQFAFGGLFSAFFVFYSRSGSLLASWPFLIILLGMLIGNEIIVEKYKLLVFQISIYFFILFSYLIFLVPLITGIINTWMFVISSTLSLIGIAVFIYLVYRIAPHRVKEAKRNLSISICTIFVLIQIFYFANIIPPLPLSL